MFNPLPKQKLKVKFKFSLGQELRDKVSGLQGVVMVRAEYSTGCHHYGIQPRKLKDDGTPHSWEWIDQSQLEPVASSPVEFNVEPETTSGPMPTGPQR